MKKMVGVWIEVRLIKRVTRTGRTGNKYRGFGALMLFTGNTWIWFLACRVGPDTVDYNFKLGSSLGCIQ